MGFEDFALQKAFLGQETSWPNGSALELSFRTLTLLDIIQEIRFKASLILGSK